MYKYKSTGTIRYSPENYKGQNRSSQWWILLDCCPELIAYYRYWMKELHGIKLQRPLWGSHISVVRGDQPPISEPWGIHAGRVIEFTYDTSICDNRRHWWLNIESPELEHMRIELGLPSHPEFGFHLTLGMKG
jgi:hypothetical protein